MSLRRTLRPLIALPFLTATGLGFLMLPGARRLPSYRRRSLEDVVTIRDAVALCRSTGLKRWDLVTYAQRLVARKFATFSTINLWDPPGRAFIYGMGYCTQYNLALRLILRRLGFQTRAVFAFKVEFIGEEWAMGHTWLQVTIDGETRAVCAGRETNLPGQVNFVPISPVHIGRPLTLFGTHVGLILYAGALEWKALLTGRQPPTWTYEERNRSS